MDKDKKTWILGAGSSISNNNAYPNINQIFSRAKEFGIINETVKTLKPEYLELQNYILDSFKKNVINKSENVDIEKLMTFLQIEFEKRKSLNNIKLMEVVIDLIKKVLIACEEKGKELGEYEYFAKNYLDEFTSVLTFNWDLSLDKVIKGSLIYKNSIINISSNNLEGYLNHKIPFPTDDLSHFRGFFLKMHGSIDWFYCPNDKCRVNNRMYILESSISNTKYCSECYEECKVLIIPPLLNKNYDSYPAIRKVWTKAFIELQNSSEIIIWGYCVPPTDFYSNWLLTRSINEESKIKIINPDCIKIKTNDYGEESYKVNRLFTSKFKEIFPKQNLEFYYNFDDFKNKSNINKKYSLKI